MKKKITRWVKFTFKIFMENGETEYCTRHIAQLEGQTNKDTTDYLVKDFKNHVGLSGIIKYRLISVDGEKVDRDIE